MKKLAIIVPCFNEEEVLEMTTSKLLEILGLLKEKGKISKQSAIYYVDDGSHDSTWSIIERLSVQYNEVHGFKLSRNKGHQNALIAGLENAYADIYITIDADLQDDVLTIEQMIDRHLEGFEIVYGVRISRSTDSFLKRFTAEWFYRIMKFMGVDLVFNHADYRLMSRRAVESLLKYPEVNLFLRGLVPTIGYSSTTVGYERNTRVAGESKYPFMKMFGLAINGITSFTPFPLRAIAVIGCLIFFVSLALSMWALSIKLFTSQAVPGWASSVLPMYLLSGIQLLSLGIIGEYIAKIYLETKRRPRYFIDKTV